MKKNVGVQALIGAALAGIVGASASVSAYAKDNHAKKKNNCGAQHEEKKEDKNHKKKNSCGGANGCGSSDHKNNCGADKGEKKN